MTQRGFVASGASAVGDIAATARDAELWGYSTFWITVVAGRTDPVEALGAALLATDSIEVGLGLVPLSAFGGGETARAVLAAGLPLDRAIVALGVGQRYERAAERWTREAEEFRAAAPELRLAVGGYGPRVLRAGGRLADAVLLNWMTPERLRWSVERVDEGARAARRAPPRPIYLYVSAASGPGAAERIDAALAAFARYPYHRRHQDAMAATGPVGAAVSGARDVEPALAVYEGAIPVVNPVGDVGFAGRREVLELFAPGTSGARPDR